MAGPHDRRFAWTRACDGWEAFPRAWRAFWTDTLGRALPQPEALKEPVSFVLSTTACLGLQKLKKLMDLSTRDLVLECLIADAVRELEAEQAVRKKG